MNITLISSISLPISKKRLYEAIRIILKRLHASQSGVSFLLCSDACIKRFNARFLHRNRLTDVLAFFDDKKFPGYDPSYLGDVVISVERARQQAKRLGHSAAEELLILIIHGMLHLRGYDDTIPDKKKKMFRKQEVLFRKYIAPLIKVPKS